MKTALLVTLTVFFYSAKVVAQVKPWSVVTKVEKNSVRLKWFAPDYMQLKLLIDKGATIDRIRISEGTEPKSADYSGAVTTVIAPTVKRFNALNPTQEQSGKLNALLEPFLTNPVTDTLSQNFSFALLTLDNSVSELSGQLIGADFTDNTVERNTNYCYRISVNGSPVAYAVVNTAVPTVYPKITDPTVKLDQKKSVELLWNAREYNAFGYGFQLEKSLDSPKEGNYLTASPYVPVRTQAEKAGKDDFFRDDSLVEGKTHFYRLVGLNYFGQPAMYSKWIKIYVPKHLHAEIYIDSIAAIDKQRIIRGVARSIDDHPKNLAGYALYKSPRKDDGYELVQRIESLDSVFTFTVPMPQTGDQFYYKVAGISTDRDTVFSLSKYFFTLDQEAPTSPSLLAGNVDSLGVVHLSWKAPTDTDLLGYRIFRANHKREEFTERNKTLSLETNFQDTVRLDNLTSEVYYCIKSVDKNYNNSTFSDTLLLIKPDTIAPVPSLLSKPLAVDSVIRLTWVNSPSTDIGMNYLLRISGNIVDTLTRWTNELTAFDDSEIIAGSAYGYYILTVDKAHNNSQCTARQVYFEPGYRKALKEVRVVSNTTTNSVEIEWQPPTENVFSYQIYKSTNDGELTLLKTIENPDCKSYTDKQTRMGNRYGYTVKYILKSGIHSLPTKKIEVVL